MKCKFGWNECHRINTPYCKTCVPGLPINYKDDDMKGDSLIYNKENEKENAD